MPLWRIETGYIQNCPTVEAWTLKQVQGDDLRLKMKEVTMGYRVVVAGATGNVGQEMLNILAEREFPLDDLAVLASSRSTGTHVDYGDTDKKYKVQNIEHFDWNGWDMAPNMRPSRRRRAALSSITARSTGWTRMFR
jgi:Semialdehyde dehydrogenase, NAD binding domain